MRDGGHWSVVVWESRASAEVRGMKLKHATVCVA